MPRGDGLSDDRSMKRGRDGGAKSGNGEIRKAGEPGASEEVAKLKINWERDDMRAGPSVGSRPLPLPPPFPSRCTFLGHKETADKILKSSGF